MEVRTIGRLQWYVSSETRPEMAHLVDFEPTTYNRFRKVMEHGKLVWEEGEEVTEPTFCSCEAFNMLHHRPCKHQRRVISHLVNSIQLTGEERERMTFQLEELCRQSPYYTHPEPVPEDPEAHNLNSLVGYPAKPASSIKSKKRDYTLYENPKPKR